MERRPEEPEREHRIVIEIVVDAYNETERCVGWHAYLQNMMLFPFTARCVEKRRTSPLAVGDEVDVVAMAPSDECEAEMFVDVEWNDRTLAVPLAQLEAVDADEATVEAVEDWRYWVERGYRF